jgi:outer membrane protein, multidrug efflux system
VTISSKAKWFGLFCAFGLSGCNFAPHYDPPKTAVPAAYKESGDWSPSVPADSGPRGDWWLTFSDATLNDLIARLEKANPTLAASVARYDQAAAAAAQGNAALFPSVDARGSAVRQRLSGERPLGTAPYTYHDYIVGLSASYELDLWGRVRNLVRSGEANRQASAADLASVRLSLEAQCSELYFQLRGLDAQITLLDDTVEAYGRALQLTDTRYQDGAASGLDVGRARTQLSTAKVQRTDLAATRATVEHALAALVGELPTGFSIPASQKNPSPSTVPTTAPSVLLQRRPDVAGAERRMAAANARIGIQRAAFFPAISLNASAGYETTAGDLLTAPTSFWAIGPATALLSVFDGGQRRAAVDAAKAAFDEAAANYRATVLTAFRDVEDQMVLVNQLAGEAKDQDDAVVAATRTADLALTRYNEGAASYLEVVTAQTAELDARRSALILNTRRLQASVDLIRAMGGGWQVEVANAGP